MRQMTNFLEKTLVSTLFVLITSLMVFSQPRANSALESQEISEAEGIPVIIKHLPDWKNKQKDAVFIKNKEQLYKALGEREVFSVVDFIADTEAVTANYEEGKLLIVEYGTPQASADTDQKVKGFLSRASGAQVFYRRIGNYNVFLFDGYDQVAANLLIDKIKYEKVVRWLTYDPFALQRAERSFISQTKDLFIATVMVILSGLLLAIVFGIIAGLIFYSVRRRRRAVMEEFSDGGGLTRLNLDHFTPDISPGNLLKD